MVDTFTPALSAIGNLFDDGFMELNAVAGRDGTTACDEIEQAGIVRKRSVFYQHFLPFRTKMVVLLVETYRRYFRLALAHAAKCGDDPTTWAWNQLQPAVGAALYWMREWFILACDGQNQAIRREGSVDYVPGGTVSLSIPITVPPFPPPTSWLAPAWLFGISIALFGVGAIKQDRVPRSDSEERLSAAYTRLLLKGARRVFLWAVAAAIKRVVDQETAAAGAVREQAETERRRGPNKRKGWEQRTKLYGVIRKVLSANPNLQAKEFCAELDRRHAPPLLDWMTSEEWREGLTWKEAWDNRVLRRKIRRVRQEAQKAS